MSVSSPPGTPGVAPGAAPVYIRGVPHALPADEQLLWEGAPAAGPIAKRVFHRTIVLAYFAVVTGWWAISTYGTVSGSDFLAMFGVRLLLAAIVIGVIEYLARAMARTTVYALTSKRLVLKIGIVLPMTINLPLRLLQDAGVARFRDGTGQIALTLVPGDRLAYIALWPHCKMFTLNQPSPVLRGLSDPDHVAGLLRDAILADAAGDAESSVIAATPSRAPRASASHVPLPS